MKKLILLIGILFLSINLYSASLTILSKTQLSRPILLILKNGYLVKELLGKGADDIVFVYNSENGNVEYFYRIGDKYYDKTIEISKDNYEYLLSIDDTMRVYYFKIGEDY